MSIYMFFAVDACDGVLAQQSIHCFDDEDARLIATSHVTADLGVEVWDAGRRVSKLARATNKTASPPRSSPAMNEAEALKLPIIVR